jgi:hypothetical protein
MKLKFSPQIYEKSSNIKFHLNPTSGSRVVPRGRKDIMKLIVVFRNFANATKNRVPNSTKTLYFPIQLLENNHRFL